MKTHPRMKDKERKEAWATVDTLEEAIEEALAHRDLAASSDPYFQDLTDAIWDMIWRCYETRLRQQGTTVISYESGDTFR